MLSIPPPRVVVIEDLDRRPGWGIYREDSRTTFCMRSTVRAWSRRRGARYPAVHALKFPLFARNVSVSHAYAHVFDSAGRWK